MRHILIPLDDASDTEWVVRHVLQLHRIEPLKVSLLSVQAPLSSYVTRFLNRSDVADFHRENGMKLIQAVGRKLDVANIEHVDTVVVGPKAECIVQYAEENRCSRIVLPRHRGLLNQLGLGTLGSQLRHLIGADRACEISEAY